MAGSQSLPFPPRSELAFVMVDPDCQSQTWIMAKRLPAGFQLRTANFQECTTHDSTPHGAFRPDGLTYTRSVAGNCRVHGAIIPP
jgi:hypothetical protein